PLGGGRVTHSSKLSVRSASNRSRPQSWFSTACGPGCGTRRRTDVELVVEAADLWTTCKTALQGQVSDAVWQSTFQDITALSADDGILRLAVPNGLVRERVESRYQHLVESIVADATGQQMTIEVVVQAAIHE